MTQNTKLLPIGTIVMLHGFTVNDQEKKVMIYGRKQVSSKTGDVYDYVACIYPEGNISSTYNVFFNHDDISRIIFKGYEDAEERAWRMTL